MGRALHEFAEREARRRGLSSVAVSTHENMTENQTLYTRIGCVPFDHRITDVYARVFMRRALD